MTVLLALAPLSNIGSAHGDARVRQLSFPTREAEIRYYLAYYGLSPHWIRVMRVESGWNFDSYIAREGNNFFGMHAVQRRTTTARGTISFYARYPSVRAAVADLWLWSALNPQQSGESFEQWLRRRRWNPNPGYYRYLAEIPLP